MDDGSVYNFNDHSAFRQFNFYAAKNYDKVLEDTFLFEEADDYRRKHANDEQWQQQYRYFGAYFTTDRETCISVYQLSRCADIDFFIEYITKTLLPNPSFSVERLKSQTLFHAFECFLSFSLTINNYRRRLRKVLGEEENSAEDIENEGEEEGEGKASATNVIE